MAIVNSVIYQISNQQTPPGCVAKTIKYVSRLDLFQTDYLDLTTFILSAKIDQLQSVFIDNRLNAGSPVSLTVNETGQTISIPKNSQGFVPLLVLTNSNATFTIASSGAVPVTFFFLNVPMPAAVWAAS